MPMQNRSRPDGILIADPACGMFMGNRGGRIHDPVTRELTKRNWANKRWICCVTEFKGRQRKVMGESYTELFFLDEVTALAAGHRPCFECRRADAMRFAEAFAEGNAVTGNSADEMDALIHPNRTLVAAGKPQALSAIDLPGMPDGTVVKAGDRFFALKDRKALPWTPSGYGPAQGLGSLVRQPVTLITPKPILNTLKAGYNPAWHHSGLF